MILTIAGSPLLGGAFRSALEQAGETVRETTLDSGDLFGEALGCRAIVLAPAPSLLDQTTSPVPRPDDVQRVLRASEAPGVRLIVLVQAARDELEDEVKPLRKYGKPYVVLRSAPLVEELAAQAPEGSSLWVPRDRAVLLTAASALASAVVHAIDAPDAQGRIVNLAAERLTLPEALRRAGRRPVAVPAVVDAARRRFDRWVHRPKPPVLDLYERLPTVA